MIKYELKMVCKDKGKKMPELELLEYYKKMCERNIVLDFQGAISQDMLVGMAELIKNKFSQKLDSTIVAKKIFSVFVEMAQNIAFYSAERVVLDNHHPDVGAGVIVVTEKSGLYTITSGNLVKNESIDGIISHCDVINKMDREELKQFYKIKIKSTRQNGKKGGGIGLIDIVRKSGNPLVYKVTPVDNQHSFLVLSVKIQED
ncbi:MAG: hypothetical protein GY757_51095 [bacterium]|nr:hypothetical protein [bacterium]